MYTKRTKGINKTEAVEKLVTLVESGFGE